MSVIVTQPFLIFYDRAGTPLDAGYIYIGAAGINPETAPITVYWDASQTATAAQPIRTLNGYPSRDGSPSMLFASQNEYSLIVKDRAGALVYSDLNFQAPGYNTRQLQTATAGQTVFNLSAGYSPGANSLVVYVNGLLLETPSDYAETSSTSITFTLGLAAGDQVTTVIKG